MTQELISRIKQAGVHLWVENGELRYHARDEALSGVMLAEIQRNEKKLILSLQYPDPEIENRARTMLGLENLENEPRALSVRVEYLWRVDNFAPNVPLTGSMFFPMGRVPDMDILHESIAAVVRRHDVLHTRLAIINDRPIQIIEEWEASDLEIVDVLRSDIQAHREAGPRSALSEFESSPLDLFADQAGFRCRVFRDEDQNVTLGILQHHFFGDAWSSQILRREIKMIYAAMVKKETADLQPVTQYKEYALLQRRSLNRNLAAHLKFWRQRLENAPSSRLPYDYRRNTNQIGRVFFVMTQELLARLTAVSNSEHMPLFMISLAAFQLALARWCGENEIVSAVNVADRINPQFRNTVGFLLTCIPVYSKIAKDMSFRNFLSTLARDLYEGYAHQDLAFELYDGIFSPPQPFCTSRFNYIPLQENFFSDFIQSSAPSFNGILATPSIGRTSSHRDLYVGLVEYRQALVGRLFYDADLFTLETIEVFIGIFRGILKDVSENPNRTLGELI